MFTCNNKRVRTEPRGQLPVPAQRVQSHLGQLFSRLDVMTCMAWLGEDGHAPSDHASLSYTHTCIHYTHTHKRTCSTTSSMCVRYLLAVAASLTRRRRSSHCTHGSHTCTFRFHTVGVRGL